MTENEAIEKIKDLSDRGYPTLRTAKEIAIKALEEIQQYREIGTVEECLEAVEKQKPEKPEIYTDTISHGGHYQSRTDRKGAKNETRRNY